jgi:hypothetical protein
MLPLIILWREGFFIPLFFESQLCSGAVNPVGVISGLERILFAGIWADGVDCTGFLIIGNRHNKGAGSPLVFFRNPGFTVFAELAIVSFNHSVSRETEKTGDLVDYFSIVGKAYLGAASAAPPALEMFPLGVVQHKITSSFLPYIQNRPDFI